MRYETYHKLAMGTHGSSTFACLCFNLVANFMTSQITRSLKKSTAKFLRDQIEETKYSFTTVRKFLVEICVAVILGLGISTVYVFWFLT